MNTEQLARASGARFYQDQGDSGTWDFTPAELKAFARLVAAHQRETDASICNDIANTSEPDDFAIDAVTAAADAIRKGES